MILYYILTYFALRSLQLLAKGQLVNTLGVNLSDPSYDSGSESAPYIVTTDSAGNIVQDGQGNELSSSIRGLSGVTMVDMWVLNTTFAGNAHPITTNLSQYSNDGVGLIGPSMSQSSGVFTFPETGYYKITFIATAETANTDTRETRIVIQTSLDGSTFTNATLSRGYITRAVAGSSNYFTMVTSFPFKVSDTSTHKVQFNVFSAGGTSIDWLGLTTQAPTLMLFERLGDL